MQYAEASSHGRFLGSRCLKVLEMPLTYFLADECFDIKYIIFGSLVTAGSRVWLGGRWWGEVNDGRVAAVTAPDIAVLWKVFDLARHAFFSSLLAR